MHVSHSTFYIPSLTSSFIPAHYIYVLYIRIYVPLPPYVYFSPSVVMTSTQLGERGRCCSGAGWDTTERGLGHYWARAGTLLGAGWDTTGRGMGHYWLMEKAEGVMKKAEAREEAEARIRIMESQCEILAELADQAGSRSRPRPRPRS